VAEEGVRLAMEGDKIAGKRPARHHWDTTQRDSHMLTSVFRSFPLLCTIFYGRGAVFALAGSVTYGDNFFTHFVVKIGFIWLLFYFSYQHIAFTLYHFCP